LTGRHPSGFLGRAGYANLCRLVTAGRLRSAKGVFGRSLPGGGSDMVPAMRRANAEVPIYWKRWFPATWSLAGSALLLVGLAAGRLPAQDESDPAAEFDFALGDDGQLLVTPHPLSTAADGTGPLIDVGLDGSFANLGMLGVATLLFGGPSDLASLSDAPRFFERLGLSEDAELLQRIGRAAEPGDAPYVGLVRLLAVRAVERRGVKAALPLLERTAADEAADPLLRTAAREAIEVLRGRPRPVGTPQLEDLGAVLERVPDGADFVLRVDRYRVPGAPSLPHWARLTALEVTRQMAGPGGVVGEDNRQQAVLISEIPGALPYAIARQYGNHRIDRAVVALQVPRDGAAIVPSVWGVLDGAFDVERITGGLTAAAVPFDEAEDGIEVPLGAGYVVKIGPRQVRIVGEQFPEVARDAAPARMLEVLAGGATAALFVGDEVPLPDAVARVRPLWLSLDVPPTGAGSLRLRGRWPDPTGAAALRGMIRSAPGLLERAAGEIDAIEPVLDALDGMTDELDGERLTVEVPIPDVELGRVVFELARSRLLR
jgi:hypothetical protein